MVKLYSNDSRIDSVLTDAPTAVSSVNSWSPLTYVGGSVSLTYDWMTSAFPGAPFGGFLPFSAEQRAGAVAAMNLVSEVANVTFDQQSRFSSAYADIEFGTLYMGGDLATGYLLGIAGTQSTTSGPGPNNSYYLYADVYLTNTFPDTADQSLGSIGFATMLHELGHALGLEHTFENRLPPPGTDTNQYSIMSYNYHPDMYVEPSTYMLYDIAALQYLYGANYTTRTGNDIYSWLTDEAMLLTIWDAGGYDYIDASSQYRNTVISLEAGTFSSIGTNGIGGNAVNNVAVAYGAVIEAGTGGSGNDQIYGSQFNNVLTGNAGYDYIDGGGGFDYITYGGATTGVIVQLYSNTANSDGTGSYDVLANIEGVLGGNHADILSGDTSANYIFSGAGSDQIFAGQGDDIIGGGAGQDYLFGDLGNDYFSFLESEFALNEFDTIADFGAEASNFDYLLFSGISRSDLQMFDYGGHAFITPTALNYAGGIVLLNTTVDEISDQLFFY